MKVAVLLMLILPMTIYAQQSNPLVSDVYGNICAYEAGVLMAGRRPYPDEFHVPDKTTFGDGWQVSAGTSISLTFTDPDTPAGEFHIAELKFEEGYAFYEDIATGASPFTYTFESDTPDVRYVIYIENDWSEVRDAFIEIHLVCGAPLESLDHVTPVHLENSADIYSDTLILTILENTPAPLMLYASPSVADETDIFIGKGSQLGLLESVENEGQTFYEVRLANGTTGFLVDGESETYFDVSESALAVPSALTCPRQTLPALFQQGEQGYPSYGWGNSTLRETPGGDPIMDIPEGELFTVMSPPTCTSNGTMWYLVEYDGNYGYISQGTDEKGYWVSRADE